jgi:hypothetical protein
MDRLGGAENAPSWWSMDPTMARTQRPVTLDITAARIAAFNDAHGGGVAVKKSGGGYSLYREHTGEPVARLRPVGLDDRFEILWWSYRERWESLGAIGGAILPLTEALELVARDPYGCFWH